MGVVPEDYASVLGTARRAFRSGKTKGVTWRREQLKRFLQMLDENEALLCQALFQDLHKPKQEAVTMEIEYCRNVIRGCLAQVDVWPRDEYVEKNLLTVLDTTYIRREPYGLVLILGAWNYPIQLTLAPVAGALAAGNCVLIKPSEVSPHTAEVITTLFNRYMDSECCRAITGGVTETTALLTHRFDYIFFTGSAPVGRIIGQAANQHLTPCTLELGGKCPVWLDESANLDTAVRRIIWGKMVNLGQICVAPDYVICTEKVREQFVRQARQLVREFFGPEPVTSPDLCRIINDRHVGRLKGLLERTRGRIETGGVMDEAERFLELTLVSQVEADDPLMEEEIFGPILPLVTVTDLDEAIAFINAKPKPLSLYIFSSDSSAQNQLVDDTSSGSVCINDVIVQLSVETLPFGGVGESGYGSYHGKYTFETFSHRKSVLKRDLGFVGEQIGISRYPPYSDRKIRIINQLVKARSMPHIPGFRYILCVGLGFGLAYLAQYCFQSL